MDMTFARTCTRKLAENPFVLSSVSVAAAPNRREPLVTLQQRTQSKQKQWLPSVCIRHDSKLCAAQHTGLPPTANFARRTRHPVPVPQSWGRIATANAVPHLSCFHDCSPADRPAHSLASFGG